MSVFEGSAPDPVELSKSSVTKTPEYLTNFLTQLASAGTGALVSVTPGTPATDTTPGTAEKVTPLAGKELIAERADFYKNLMTPGTGENLPTMGDLTRYQSPLDTAATTAGYAQGVDSADISKFYDPYQQKVVDELARQSALNTQRNVLPMLRGAFAGQGGFGSQRYAGALGQAAGDIEANLLGKQAELMSAGYKNAMDAALREQGVQQGLVGSLGTLGTAEATAAQNAIKSLSEAGASDLAYKQSLIDAPVKRALNVAEIMRGYQYPTTVEETKEEIPTNFSPSALQQIAGLGTLVGAAFPPGGGGLGNKIVSGLEGAFDWLKRQGGAYGDSESGGSGGTDEYEQSGG